jgi:hypothetical protein
MEADMPEHEGPPPVEDLAQARAEEPIEYPCVARFANAEEYEAFEPCLDFYVRHLTAQGFKVPEIHELICVLITKVMPRLMGDAELILRGAQRTDDLGCADVDWRVYCDPETCPRVTMGETEDNPWARDLKERFEVLFMDDPHDQPTLVMRNRFTGTKCRLRMPSVTQMAAALARHVGDVQGWADALGQAAGTGGSHRVAAILPPCVQRLALGVPTPEECRILRGGAHFLKENDTFLLVTHNESFMLNPDTGRWQRITSARVHRNVIVMADAEAGQGWLKWDARQLNAPLTIEPGRAFELLHGAVEVGWDFCQASDYLIHALLPFCLSAHPLFPRKQLIHIRGESKSGKSRMTFGWYAGTEGSWLVMGGPYLPLSNAQTSVTEAGFRRDASSAGFVPILDEQEQQSSADLPKILRLLRAVTYGGGRTTRAKYAAEGVVREHISCPVIVASVDPISSDEADMNRWLVTETDRTHGRETPEDEIAKYWGKIGPVDFDELRRTVFLTALQDPKETQQAHDHVRLNSADICHGMETRYRENIYPLLAVAKIIGLDWRKLAEAIYMEKVQHQASATEHQAGVRLLDRLMTAQLDPRVRGLSGHDTLVQFLYNADLPHSFPSLGAALFLRKGRGGKVRPHLAIRWEAARTSLLRGTTFADLSNVKLNQIAHTIPGFVPGTGGKNTHILRFEGLPKMRWVLVELSDEWSPSELYEHREETQT